MTMRPHIIYLSALLALTLTGCKQERKSNDIITKIVRKTEPDKGPRKLSDFRYERQIEWLGTTYTLRIRRYADPSMPLTTDEDGRKYYDNRVQLLILRKDGTTFVDRTFTKTDFHAFTDSTYSRRGALIGFMFDRVEGSTIRFGASVGSPDPNSDEYVPIDVIVNRDGGFAITSSSQLDTATDRPQPTRKKSEIEASEEEGM